MTRSIRLLVVDDDPSVCEWISVLAERLGYGVETVGSGEEALESFRRGRPDLVTLDVLLPGIGGLETLKSLQSLDPRVPVIMLSGHGQTSVIVEALRMGAVDFLKKPFEPEQLKLSLRKALEKSELEQEVALLRRRAPRVRQADASLFVFSDTPKMRVIEDMIEHVADTDITVLIRGESGTGKELVARTLYERSARPNGPFVKINCAALPSELLESELFGYERGAFTGAQRRKLGKFEIANGGTIFLDEISEMAPKLQAKLLQVLQDGQFSRLGGEGDIRVDTRVVAATNHDLEQAVRDGTFREDLFYRLNVVSILIPPLRERRNEIAPLVDHFLRRYSRAYAKEHRTFSDGLMGAFWRYHWPGNVRELENLVKRFVVLGSEESLLQELEARSAEPRAPRPSGSTDLDRYLAGEVDRINLKKVGREAARAAEKRLIEKVLRRTRWNRREAAEILKISYKALLYKMKDAGLANSA